MLQDEEKSSDSTDDDGKVMDTTEPWDASRTLSDLEQREDALVRN
jgi:hypothetical protein